MLMRLLQLNSTEVQRGYKRTFKRALGKIRILFQ